MDEDIRHKQGYCWGCHSCRVPCGRKEQKPTWQNEIKPTWRDEMKRDYYDNRKLYTIHKHPTFLAKATEVEPLSEESIKHNIIIYIEEHYPYGFNLLGTTIWWSSITKMIPSLDMRDVFYSVIEDGVPKNKAISDHLGEVAMYELRNKYMVVTVFNYLKEVRALFPDKKLKFSSLIFIKKEE